MTEDAKHALVGALVAYIASRGWSMHIVTTTECTGSMVSVIKNTVDKACVLNASTGRGSLVLALQDAVAEIEKHEGSR